MPLATEVLTDENPNRSRTAWDAVVDCFLLGHVFAGLGSVGLATKELITGPGGGATTTVCVAAAEGPRPFDAVSVTV